MPKTNNASPLQHPIVEKICERLGEDAEAVDFYLWRYYGLWGENGLQAMFRFIVSCERESHPELIRETLLHDFTIERDGKEKPLTARY